MKKIIIFVFLFIFMFCFVACGGNSDTGNNGDSNGEQPKKETVTVEYNGTSMANATYDKGAQLIKPSDPSKNGYIFGGWYVDSSFSTEAKFPIVLNSNTTLYAKFYSYQEAFEQAREKTIGANVEGFEFDYTVTASVTYSALSLSGNTKGSAQYSKNGDVNYYDEAVNSGALFNDGTKYQIKKNNSLQKISINEKGVLKKFDVEEVDDNYRFDSSSFAKAVFEYSSDQLKSIQKTSVNNEYELKTSMNASQAMSLVGNYVNHPMVEKVLGTLPETSVNTGMYVTFSGGVLKSYRYEMHIDVSSIKFDLVYNLTFTSVGKAITIVPKTFGGIAISSSDIENYNTAINHKLVELQAMYHSGYDFVVKTGLNFPSKNEINSTFQGSTLRKLDNSTVYFHNDIEIDSDYKNADLYKEAGISDIHVKKTKLSNGDVYYIEKKVLADKTYLQEGYQLNKNDAFFLLPMLDYISQVSFIQMLNKDSTVTYSIGISSSDVANILEWINNNLDLDPLNTATTDVKIFGDINKSTIKVKDSEFVITIVGGMISTIEINAKGTISTKLAGSRDFTSTQEAAFDLSYKITTKNGDSYEPYDSVNKSK